MIDKELKDNLRAAKIVQYVLRDCEGEVCDICDKFKDNIFDFKLSAENVINEFSFCASCISEAYPALTKEVTGKVMFSGSLKRLARERANFVDDITEEVSAIYPQLYRNLELFLDGYLTMADGSEHEILTDLYNKTIKRNRMPSEKQVGLFNTIAGQIISAKNAGVEYKEKYNGLEVDNLISGLGVAKVPPKYADAFESIKGSYKNKGWISQKQFNFLKVMKNA